MKKILSKLEELVKELDCIVYCYCFMATHYHLLVEEVKDPIANLMSRLLTSYGLYFNRKYERSGPLFADRFKSILVQKESYFLQLSPYIHLNPVHLDIVKDPRGYLYLSFNEYLKERKVSDYR